jgi:hypothetical protein
LRRGARYDAAIPLPAAIRGLAQATEALAAYLQTSQDPDETLTKVGDLWPEGSGGGDVGKGIGLQREARTHLPEGTVKCHLADGFYRPVDCLRREISVT